ncbi:DUF452 family protein [Desulfobulbus sp. TB]|nr:DUF452 family protein [Desulfobulbus sp. TB]
MKTCWLHQQERQDCLLFFAGWGMHPEPFYDIPAGAVDVLMVSDYRSLECTDLASLLQDLGQKIPYTRFHLLAWSMGVWAASMLSAQQIFSPLPLTTSIAIAGTCYPLHDRLGIPKQNFVNMVEQLSPARLQAFQRSMFADKQEADEADTFIRSFHRGGRSVQELQEELAVLAQAATEQPEAPDIYTSKVVTGRDRIFPARHQIRAWGRKQCRTVSLPHFPFYHWPSWSAMIHELT